MRRSSWWLVCALVASSACGAGTPASAFPTQPAACAGPDRSGFDRRQAWQDAAEDSSQRVLAVSLAETRTPSEVIDLIGDELAITGVLVVFQELQGPYVKAFSAPAPAIRSEAELSRHIDEMLRRRDRDGIHAPADSAPLDRGDYPIGGLWLEGERPTLARWVTDHQCEVWLVAPARECCAPMPSPAVDPT